MTVKMTQVDATAIYQLGISIAPLHYYGDVSLYDYDNNKFGFEKGDLSTVREKTTEPMGAGPYKFIKFADGVVNFEANEKYYLGAPKTKYINFLECLNDNDKLNGVINGTIDITDPSFSSDTVEAIKDANGGELDGAKVTTNTVDNLGYGYIGQNAKVQKVGDDPASEESKALRKAYATILAVYRDVAIDSYYGDRASVINYPISSTSWAAPQATDEGYQIAFSVDVDGKPIYTADMTPEQKYAAAQKAAIGFFKAAGYTFDEASGKFTAAPEGASLSYEVIIPGDGTGDHPSFAILTDARESLGQIGIELKINDPADSNVLWDALDAGTQNMWAAAWGSTIDPDMYQVYHSSNIVGLGGSDSNHYHIQSAELDKLILDARQSSDQAYRKEVYTAALNEIMDWAVEIPAYQRQNIVIASSKRVDIDTVTKDVTTYWGWLAELQTMKMVEATK